jgi:hypothetical protein
MPLLTLKKTSVPFCRTTFLGVAAGAGAAAGSAAGSTGCAGCAGYAGEPYFPAELFVRWRLIGKAYK